MLSGRGLCDDLITRPEESYRLWCVVVCDLGNLVNEEAMARVGTQRNRGGKKNCGYSPTSPLFLLLSEHKHCDNAATNSNIENARSRMVASLRGSVG